VTYDVWEHRLLKAVAELVVEPGVISIQLEQALEEHLQQLLLKNCAEHD